jgi:hypothetical protein
MRKPKLQGTFRLRPLVQNRRAFSILTSRNLLTPLRINPG